MSDSLRAADILKDHRDSIDRLDAILVYTLGERFKHTQAVGKLKATFSIINHINQNPKETNSWL